MNTVLAHTYVVLDPLPCGEISRAAFIGMIYLKVGEVSRATIIQGVARF